MVFKWLAALLILITVFEFWRIRSLTKISSQLIAATKVYEQHPVGSKYKVLIMGDSTGVGIGAQDADLTLAGRLGHDWPEADISNIAVSGLRTDQLDSKTGSVKEGYDLIIIHIGGNDIIRFKNIDQAAANIEEAVKTLSPKTKKIAVFTTGNMGESDFFPFLSKPMFTMRSKALRNKVKKVTSSYPDTTYVDLFSYPADLKSVGGYAKDKLHLSNEGYALWYQALQDSFKPAKLLGQ